jgi:quercetin dioxygenase-like cupin family protein
MENVALDVLGDKLLAMAREAPSGRHAVTVHGGQVHSLRQTLIGLVAGRALVEHENTGEVTLLVLRGRARVVAGEDVSELGEQGYAVVPLQWDSFEAIEDTVVLLSAAVLGSAV